MWWLLEQQARRRRARAASAPATAEWLPHEVVGNWWVAGVGASGNWNAFSLVNPATVQWMELGYTAVTALVGLQNLTALESLNLTYAYALSEIPALPASLTTLQAAYSGLVSIPNVTTSPNLTYINFRYSPYLEGADAQKVTLMQQLDANGAINGTLDIGSFNTGFPGGNAAIDALMNKGWEVYV